MIKSKSQTYRQTGQIFSQWNIDWYKKNDVDSKNILPYPYNVYDIIEKYFL